MATLPQNVSEMSMDEKCDLLDALMIDIWSQPDVLPQSQIDELDRRMEAYANDSSLGVPWEQIEKRPAR